MYESYPQPFKVALLCLLIVCMSVCARMCACVHVRTCHCAYVEVREQHGGAGSLLIAHGSQGLGLRVWLVSMHTYLVGHLAGSKVGVFEASWPELASAHPTRWR